MSFSSEQVSQIGAIVAAGISEALSAKGAGGGGKQGAQHTGKNGNGKSGNFSNLGKGKGNSNGELKGNKGQAKGSTAKGGINSTRKFLDESRPQTRCPNVDFCMLAAAGKAYKYLDLGPLKEEHRNCFCCGTPFPPPAPGSLPLPQPSGLVKGGRPGALGSGTRVP